MAAIHYTDRDAMVRLGTVSRVLTQAAFAALDAPSIQDTQPWQWRINDERAELYADRGQRLPDQDPQGRLLMVSCGAALHHARVALAADGAGVEAIRFPDAGHPDFLASLRYIGPIERSPRAQRLRRAIAVRRTDQRPFSGDPVPGKELTLLADAAEEAGARLHVMAPQELPADYDHNAHYLLLTTTGDLPGDWLTAGEGLSAVLLNATAEGLATSISDVTAITPGAGWRRVVADAGHPAAVIRAGVAGRADMPPNQPRRKE